MITFMLVENMEPLSCTQKYLQVFGFCPNPDGTVDKIVFLTRLIILYITILQALVPSICYPLFHSDEPDVFINSLIPIVGFIIVPISYVTFFLEDKSALITFSHIRSLVKERKNF